MGRQEQQIPEVGGTPKGSSRRRVSVLIGALLALQLVVPLRYYLGEDPYDERFSWRMFSAVRVVSCQTQVVEGTTEGTRRAVPLMRTIHEAWVNHLKRNREGVIRAFLSRRCEEDAVDDVVLQNQCVDAEGNGLPPIVWRIECESGDIEEPDNPFPDAVAR